MDDANKSLAKEEEDFFNQVAPNEKEKARMTKDSILALYGTAPTSATTAGSMMPGAQFPPTVAGYSAFQMPSVYNGGANNSVPGATPFAQMPCQPTANAFAPAAGNPAFFGAGAQFQSMVPSSQQVQQMPLHNLQQQQPAQTANFANFASQPAFHMAPATSGLPQMGGIMPHNMAAMGQPIAPATQSSNLNQQFGTLNLGNVWQ